jgi:hypothetical protein
MVAHELKAQLDAGFKPSAPATAPPADIPDETPAEDDDIPF